MLLLWTFYSSKWS